MTYNNQPQADTAAALDLVALFDLVANGAHFKAMGQLAGLNRRQLRVLASRARRVAEFADVVRLQPPAGTPNLEALIAALDARADR